MVCSCNEIYSINVSHNKNAIDLIYVTIYFLHKTGTKLFSVRNYRMGNNGILGINSSTHCTVKKKSFSRHSAQLSSYKQKTNKICGQIETEWQTAFFKSLHKIFLIPRI